MAKFKMLKSGRRKILKDLPSPPHAKTGNGNGSPAVQSFETARGDVFGDLLSRNRLRSNRPMKIGLLSGAFFEYWRMYPHLKGKVEQDTRVVVDRLSQKHTVVYPGLVDTVDAADHAGRAFREQQ